MEATEARNCSWKGAEVGASTVTNAEAPSGFVMPHHRSQRKNASLPESGRHPGLFAQGSRYPVSPSSMALDAGMSMTTHGLWHMHGRAAPVRMLHLEEAVPPAARVHVQWMVTAAWSIGMQFRQCLHTSPRESSRSLPGKETQQCSDDLGPELACSVSGASCLKPLRGSSVSSCEPSLSII